MARGWQSGPTDERPRLLPELGHGVAHPYDALKGFFFAPRWREVVLLAAGYLGAVQGRTEDATELVDRIRETTDVLEPHLHRHLCFAADLLAERVPMLPRCVEKTWQALLQGAESSPKRRRLANALAALSYQPPPVSAIAPAARAFGSDSRVLRTSIVRVPPGNLGLREKELPNFFSESPRFARGARIYVVSLARLRLKGRQEAPRR